MKILEEEEDDDDKASLDDILRELCLLRCSTCKTSVCSPKSDTSYTNNLLKELNLVKDDQETAPLKTQDVLVADEEAEFESEIETRDINSTTESTEELSFQDEESVRDCNEGSVESIEYLLRDGCTSLDCACIKPAPTLSDVYLDSNQRHTLESKESKKVPACLLKNVSSQTKETCFQLKKIGPSEQIKTQENFHCAAKKSDTSIPISLQCNPDSSYSSSDSFHTLPDNFFSPNPISSLGCDGQSSTSRTRSRRHSIIMDLPFELGSSSGSKNKNHMVDTYEKLLHKIERLRKMASWKTKKRKKKSKYSLQSSNDQKPNTVDQPGYLEEKTEFKLFNKAEVIMREIGVQSDSTLLSCQNPVQGLFQGDANLSGDIAELQNIINKEDDSSSMILQSISQLPEEEKRELSAAPAAQMSQNGRCCRVKETDDEILTHLKHINKLLEEDSCAGCLVQRENSVVNYQDLRNSKTASKSSRLIVERKERRKPDKGKQVKVLWAVTKVTVYPDSCRTYEVMRLSRKRPHKVPSSSDTVFVLLPNK